MASNSKIEWCDHTINFWTGCIKVSTGCKFCYMYRDKDRWKKDPTEVIKVKDSTINKVLRDAKAGDNFIFNWALSNKPKHEFIWVYIVIGNKVRWRARFAGYDEDNPEKTFSDGRRWTSTYWLLLFDFEKLPRPYEHRKGFQGFRYKR